MIGRPPGAYPAPVALARSVLYAPPAAKKSADKIWNLLRAAGARTSREAFLLDTNFPEIAGGERNKRKALVLKKIILEKEQAKNVLERWDTTKDLKAFSKQFRKGGGGNGGRKRRKTRKKRRRKTRKTRRRRKRRRRTRK